DLTLDEKQQFLEDGFIIIRNAVSDEAVAQARRLIEEALPKDERRLLVPGKLATHEHIVGLLNDSSLAAIMRNLMGPYPPIISCQVAVTPPHNLLGGKPGTHVDGGWSGAIPETADEIDPVTWRPKDAAKYFGEHDEKRGTNDGLLWMDPERKLSYGSYTGLVGVALNDQFEPGNGQFAVLKGMHEEVEACFREQRAAGGIVGPEGPNWPRIRIGKSGRPYVNGLPDAIRAKAEQLAKAGKATDSWPWPELTPVLLGAGDAVIAMHSCPHTPTPNLGPNPRMNIYFRMRRLREGNPHEGTRRVAHGVSDHPDRGYFGQYLEYPEDYNPWQTSIDKLCDHWSEWDGMQSLINRNKA
ncbi:MAG: hypothetical protein AAF512_24815, partial [Pseudomonadota bacterium]